MMKVSSPRPRHFVGDPCASCGLDPLGVRHRGRVISTWLAVVIEVGVRQVCGRCDRTQDAALYSHGKRVHGAALRTRPESAWSSEFVVLAMLCL